MIFCCCILQEAGDIKSSTLDLELKQKETQLLQQMQEKSDQMEVSIFHRGIHSLAPCNDSHPPENDSLYAGDKRLLHVFQY